MAFGLDYVAGPSVADLKAAGVTFVCRYTGYFSGYNIDEVATPQGKVLTPGEAKANSQAGITLVSNYEWYANRATESASSGAWDAHTANAIHLACGGPPTRPIYFSVDADVQGAQTAAYFKGVASVIGKSRTGAYGSYRVLQYLFDQGLITWGWQTYAWSGGAWEPRAHIQQYQNGVSLAGHDVDYNRSMHADFGQWFSGGHMPIPQGWHDANNVLTAPNNIPVTMGFRQHIIDAPAWDAGNVPQEAEYHADQVLLHNASVGAGQRQVFRDTMLWFTPAKGVIQEAYLGLEIQSCYDLIAAQQAEIATLKVQPPAPQPPTPALNLADAITTLQGLETDVASKLAQALKDLGA